MKRLAVCVLMLALILSLAACDVGLLMGKQPGTTQPAETQPAETQPVEPEKNGVEPLEVLIARQYISEYTDDYIPLGYVSWESLALGEKSAEAYPALAKAVEEYSVADASVAESLLRDMLPGAREMAEERGDDFTGFSHEATCYIQRADSRILSARFDYDAYTGGARPYFGTTALNLDPATGEALTLSQVITDWQQVPQLLTQALKEKYPDIHEETFTDIDRILKGYSQQAYTWTLGYQGITFYFGASEIAPAAVGAMEVTIWFDQYPELFAQTYTQIPEGGYAVYLPSYSWMEVDLKPGDGLRDTVYVGLDDEGTLSVAKNQTIVEDSGYFAYYADAYLVTPDNSRFYLYIDSSAENDYSTFRVFDLNGPEPRCIESIGGQGFFGVWDEDYVLGANWFTAVLNDPSHFLLADNLNILGTMSGTRVFHMDPQTGLPVVEQDDYTLPTDRTPLETKIAVKVKLLPEQTDMEIPAGTKLWFLSTDGETYVDMLLSDGKQCRIYVTYQGWQGYVNGIAEEECFEGIFYAG